MAGPEENRPLPYRKGSRVRLKEGYDLVYPNTFAGAEGIIGAYTIDPERYERILVKWDRGHWRYNEEPDMFTYAAHFEVIAPPPIEDKKPPETPEPAVYVSSQPEATSEGLGRLMAAIDSPKEDELSIVDRYAAILTKAVATMTEGTAFMLVTISPNDSGQLAPYYFAGMLDEESAHIARLVYTQIAGDVIKSLAAQYRSK